MKLTQADLPALRLSLLAIGSAVLMSSAVLYFSSEYAAKTESSLSSARNMGNDARRRLIAAKEDRENMSIYADEYGALIKRKIVGEDQRLDWMEGMEGLRQMNLVTDFRYNIAPQTNYAPQPQFDTGSYDIHYSETKLQFDLLHEGQLVDFFTTLRSKLTGWYQLEGCAIQRSVKGEEVRADAPARGTPTGSPLLRSDPSAATQLKAECTGGWVTLKSRNSPP